MPNKWKVVAIGFDNLAKETILEDKDEYKVQFKGHVQVKGQYDEFTFMELQVKLTEKTVVMKRYRN